MSDFNQLATLCHGKHIYIQTHNFPDPMPLPPPSAYSAFWLSMRSPLPSATMAGSTN